MEAARGQTDLDAMLKQLRQQSQVPVDRSSWEIRTFEVDPAVGPFLPLLEAALPPGSIVNLNPEIRTLAIFASPEGLDKVMSFVEAVGQAADKKRYEVEEAARTAAAQAAKDNQVTTAAPWASGTDPATAKSVMLEILLLRGIPKEGPPAGTGFGMMEPGGYGGGYAVASSSSSGPAKQGSPDVAIGVATAEERSAPGVSEQKGAGEAGPPKPPEFNKDAREMGLTEEDLRFLGDRGWFTLGRATVLTQSGKTFEIKVGQHLFQGDLRLVSEDKQVLLNINVSGPDASRAGMVYPGMGYPGGGYPGGGYPGMGAKGADLKIQESGLELRCTALLDLDHPAILGGGGSDEPTVVVVRPRLWIRTKAEQPETIKQY
jgi:hypothetical protein